MSEQSLFLSRTLEEPPKPDFGSDTDIPIFYHYTNFENLLSITQSAELWATNIHCLNDFEEFENALKIFRQRAAFFRKQESDQAVKDFISTMMSEAERIAAVNLHIFSFSGCGDLLSQWRGYCPDGGVAVGFRYNDILKLAQKNNFVLRKCIYSEKYKRDIMDEIVGIHIKFFKSKEETPDTLLDGFLRLIAAVAPCFKHEAFEEEQEWRLISDLVPTVDPRVGIRAKGNLMTPFIRFSLDGLPDINGKRNLSYDRYIIGPSRNSEVAESAFSYFKNLYNLRTCGLRKSNIPYRTF